MLAQRWELGLSAGGAAYMGDLNPYNPVKISGPSGGLFAKLNFTPRFALGVHYTYGQVTADDAKSTNTHFKTRNLNFSTTLNEISLLAEISFFDMFKVNARKYSPYIFFGAGNLFFEPKTNYNGATYLLRNYKTEGQEEPYANNTLVIPFGVGVKYKVTERLNVFTQIGFRTALTDYIDDVSGNYPDQTLWGTSPSATIRKALSDRSGEKTANYIGTPGTQRGDYRERDSYMFANIGISYTFAGQKCFTF